MKVVTGEAVVLALGLVPHRHMRFDVLFFDHPGQHRGGAISGIADKAFRCEIELRLDTLDHRPSRIDFGGTLRRGDTVVIWRLDRLGRSLKDLIRLVEQLDAAGVGLRSLQESIDTASIGGRLVFHLFGATAEFERNLIRERTQAGLSAARARGRKGGRKKRLDPAKQELALRLYHERQHTVAEICRMMGIGRSTLYNYLTEAERDAQRAA